MKIKNLQQTTLAERISINLQDFKRNFNILFLTIQVHYFSQPVPIHDTSLYNSICPRGSIRKIFLSLRISFARKKTAICAIIRKSHFAQNCHIPLFRHSSFAQFRNFVINICVYFLELKGFSPVGI